MAYTWENTTLPLLRAMIGDWDSESPLYDDDKLVSLLIVAAFQVNQDVTFRIDFSVSIPDKTITPDPTAEASKDFDFVNLFCIKAAAIMDRGNAVLAASKAVSGSDMNAIKFDLTGVASSTLALLKQGWCKVYDEVLYDYLTSTGNLGRAVMGPFRTYIRGYGNSPYINFYTPANAGY